jgi:hypothetical protein
VLFEDNYDVPNVSNECSDNSSKFGLPSTKFNLKKMRTVRLRSGEARSAEARSAGAPSAGAPSARAPSAGAPSARAPSASQFNDCFTLRKSEVPVSFIFPAPRRQHIPLGHDFCYWTQ